MHIFKSTLTRRCGRFKQSFLGVSVSVLHGWDLAPLIMKSVIDAIVSQDHTIKSATSAYVDDILINENRVPVSASTTTFPGLWFGFQGSGATERRS